MKNTKRIFKVFSLLMCILILTVTFVACDNNSDIEVNNPTSNNEETNQAKHYEVDITMDNYWCYIYTAFSNNGNESSSVSLLGVLSYAYYENCVVEVLCTYVGIRPQTAGDTFTATLSFKLNAAGNGAFSTGYDSVPESITPDFGDNYMGSYKKTIKIVNISGKVIYTA